MASHLLHTRLLQQFSPLTTAHVVYVYINLCNFHLYICFLTIHLSEFILILTSPIMKSPILKLIALYGHTAKFFLSQLSLFMSTCPYCYRELTACVSLDSRSVLETLVLVFDTHNLVVVVNIGLSCQGIGSSNNTNQIFRWLSKTICIIDMSFSLVDSAKLASSRVCHLIIEQNSAILKQTLH